jgi:hypothetical protein
MQSCYPLHRCTTWCWKSCDVCIRHVLLGLVIRLCLVAMQGVASALIEAAAARARDCGVHALYGEFSNRFWCAYSCHWNAVFWNWDQDFWGLEGCYVCLLCPVHVVSDNLAARALYTGECKFAVEQEESEAFSRALSRPRRLLLRRYL